MTDEEVKSRYTRPTFDPCGTWSITSVHTKRSYFFCNTIFFVIYCQIAVNYGNFPINVQIYGQNLAVITNLYYTDR